MKTSAAAAIAILAAAVDGSAHRLDEYLQATRVSIGRSELRLEVDLTPGASIAAAVTRALDRDADGAISPVEAEAYGRAVLADVAVKLDDEPVGLRLVRIDMPTIDEMQDGLGTIRLLATGEIGAGMGRHRLSFFNNHRPETSVYMVNALVPDDEQVTLGAASRDPRQREFRTEFKVMPRWAGQLLWVAICAAVMTGAIVGRRSKR